ncbi:MAG: chemotaxis protein CheV [Pseudomonadota bacterium]|uniref:Two-component system chemotaxis response regulator CheV n=1 Tax=Gallaecimonas pentaromativorans TaxID=584787 RepID=A0A3N1P2I5_9GAMM|nr:chemotaxis protein CheV [Gallaecimonas pentaromativorans]MED5526724.1 chemotaxis protein CheV [Pseudomonadota bacterium]ROQ22623.1 two-component system chemotaxis response regulator CheV [Gallaecimonas pentaromativorans]
MAGILDTVNQRTQMVGQNRLELLMFRLGAKQRFGINVFKVREVLQCPPLTALPKRKSSIRGVAHIRGQTLSVIDLRQAMGGRPTEDVTNCFIIITEYNRSVQGFLVHSVDRIVNCNWEDIQPPPKGAGRASYLTAVTEVDGEMVEMLDVEKILDEISPTNAVASADAYQGTESLKKDRVLLIADDSSVARAQIKRALEPLGIPLELVKDGRQGLDYLRDMAEQCQKSITEQVCLLISDVEMPEMDGYTLTAEIRANPKLKDLQVILHTSLSGVFNQAMVQKVGANKFIAKFDPDELANAVKESLMIEAG